jgi:DNA-binding transcriptional LysR family regulator
MGRRLDALHSQLGVKLLMRTPSGFVLTPAGENILAGVERMEADAHAVERSISGDDVRTEGLVRITTVPAFGARIVVPALAELAMIHSGISIEIITDIRALSLARREADIAIRFAPFEQHEAYVRRVADMHFGLFASTDYLSANGKPEWSEGGAGHRTIVLQDELASTPEAEWLRDTAFNARQAVLANSREIQVSACRAGLGLACLPLYLAKDHSDLVAIDSPKPLPVRGIWLGVHKDMRNTPRIRVVLEMLTAQIKARSSELAPANPRSPAPFNPEPRVGQ